MDASDFEKYLKNPILFPDEFKTWIVDFYATNIPQIPVSQILGFHLYEMKYSATVGAESTSGAGIPSLYESYSATAWGDLATEGPSLTGISNGFYLVIFGYLAAGATGKMGISIDGADPVDNDSIVGSDGNVARMFLADLTSGNHDHTLEAKYAYVNDPPPSYFTSRWLHAIRVNQDA